MTRSGLRATTLTALALLITLFGGLGPQFSSASFTAQSVNTTNTASAAVDWTPPTVSVVAPGAPLKGQVVITAQAADGETGVKSVTIQAQRSGTWTTLCTVTAAPYRCTWDTMTGADGAAELRATAIDNASYSATSASKIGRAHV